MQIPPRTETRLFTECKDAADWHTRFIAACFDLSLLANKRVEFSLCRFNFGSPNPAKIKQPNQQLPEEVESRIIVTSNDDLRTKTAQSLPNWRTHATVEKMVLARSSRKRRQSLWNSFRRKLLFIFSRDDSRRVPFKKMLLCDWAKAGMIREHVRLPLLYHRQIATPLHLL